LHTHKSKIHLTFPFIYSKIFKEKFSEANFNEKVNFTALVLRFSCNDACILRRYRYWRLRVPKLCSNVVPAITLDFHIIVGEGTSDLAIDSVGRMLSQYTETKYKTSLNIHYISEADYKAQLLADIDKTDEDKADIVLINSAELMNELVNGGKLYDLTDYYNGTTYGQLNTIITESLIDASKISGKLYSVPNDHIIGEYTYLLINEEEATNRHNFSPASLKACKSFEDDIILELKSAIEADGKKFSDYVKEVTGDYRDKAAYEADGYICNVVEYPQATADEAFSSAFAIVNGIQYPDRAMQVLFLLNSDEYFRNLLQYGVEGVNYIKEDDGSISPYIEGDGVYNMNMFYTGNSFMLYNSPIWTAEMNALGLAQNAEAVYAPRR